MDCGTTADDSDALTMRARIGDRTSICRVKKDDGSGSSSLRLSATQPRSVLEEQSHLVIHHQSAALTHCRGAHVRACVHARARVRACVHS